VTTDTLEVQLMRDAMQTWVEWSDAMSARQKEEWDSMNATGEKALLSAIRVAKMNGLSKSAVARATGVRNWKRINDWWERA